MVEASLAKKAPVNDFGKKKFQCWIRLHYKIGSVVISNHSYDNFDVTVTLVTTNFHLSNTAVVVKFSISLLISI